MDCVKQAVQVDKPGKRMNAREEAKGSDVGKRRQGHRRLKGINRMSSKDGGRHVAQEKQYTCELKVWSRLVDDSVYGVRLCSRVPGPGVYGEVAMAPLVALYRGRGCRG